MFIRKTKTNNSSTGEAYFTHRLVRGERIGGKVRQITVLNLGRNLAVKQDDWPLLCSRIEQLLQPSQLSFLTIECPVQIERAAQYYAGQLVERAAQISTVEQPEKDDKTDPSKDDISHSPLLAAEINTDYQEVDLNSLQTSQPRSVGVEHLGLCALTQLGLIEKLAELGINGVTRAAIIGNLIGRMAQPDSEIATWNWLQTHSALGELIDADFMAMSHMSLYRASDALMQHRDEIEDHVFGSIKSLFSLEETVTLYDLTNTYFEGECDDNPDAKFGRSKEKRTDCPLVTLGLVLDSSGFVRRSKTFAGNVAEASTLATMLEGLNAAPGALVIMDAGIATEANINWLIEHGYRYLVVRRGGARQFDETRAIVTETASGATIKLQKELSEDGKEVRLHCHSEGREAKETAMSKQFCERYEAGLQKIADGLAKTKAEKRHDKLLLRIGKLKAKSRGVSQHYTLNFTTDETTQLITALTWEKKAVNGTMETHPGVYCLRSNKLEWDEQKLWHTYTMLTDLESVFRSLKSELGLRPVYHSSKNRVDGHLMKQLANPLSQQAGKWLVMFITVLAYQLVQVLRVQLKQAGINDSWEKLRKTLSVQRRSTTSVRRRDGRTIHIRKSTVAEPDLQQIYKALKVNSAPGGMKKLIS
jgi:transposase